MAIDFRYVPTSGTLSGVAFEKQTEQAFNELGQLIDDTASDVSQALDVAQNARATAQNALQTAEIANRAAQDAHGLAQTARTTADSAAATAGQARAAADNALSQAGVATTIANNAKDSAERAKSLGAGAADTATDAKNSADSALAVAQRAADVAEQATGVFFVDDTVRDANEAYTTTEKSVLTNSDEDTPNTNFPQDMSVPLWFTVYMTDDGKAVTQTCWNNAAKVVYTRTGSIRDIESDTPVADWGQWEGIAALVAGTGTSINTAGEISVKYGTTAKTACQGNDARLGNARTPTAHAATHASGGTDALTAAQIGALAANGTAAAATKLATARTIGGVAFDGTANINLPGVNAAGTQNTSGTAAAATKLATARTIALSGAVTGSASFNGTANVTIATTSTAGVGAIAGEIRLLPFRVANLPTGWYFCNGDRYATTSAQGKALAALPATLKTDWGIVVSGSNIGLPNFFASDGRGYFMRAVNGTTRPAGGVELDQFQGFGLLGWTNSFEAPANVSHWSLTNGASAGNRTNNTYTRVNIISPFASDGENGSPRVGSETRPLNIGMTPAIYLGV